ncbi:hydantoinase B/oxoprolinase family protein [Pantoea sp. YR343]|uniref:hydantoinase B/oxoprolinase family protein n=1 Tax=Pantoea sp. YR343 TaxID=1144341 RepID=UPI000271150B|nr:hydantoinase B/oxoprolinase family protein [Pantoea sp. YR343]KAJ9431811.1 hydantoinase B/oxoprolinase family protein [Pantoea sp. YR343]
MNIMPYEDTQNDGRQFDAIAMEVFSNRLLSITEGMAIHMMRSSFSSQIKERRDFSVGIFDAHGRLLAQGTHIPLHLGSLLGAMEAVLARYPVTEMQEGDAFICNDPYLAGGTHLPDISIISPVFASGKLIAFAANIGHHTDVGGGVPGSISPSASTIFEEGLRIPVIRIVRAGVMDEDLLNLIISNSRLPQERRLDLQVQIAVNVRGGEETRAMFMRMGENNALNAIEDVLSYTSARLRNRITRLKEGSYTFTTWLDDDGAGSDPLPVNATVTVSGDKLLFAFDGTGPQARGAFNVPPNALRATVYYCIKALLDPELMANSGMFSAVTIKAPAGSLANPSYPAAVGVRSTPCQKIAGAIFGAFRALLPDKQLIASSNDLLPAFDFSGFREDGTFYVCGETLGGGSGARYEYDGMDAVHVHVTNSLNLPVEAMENEFPLLCEEYCLAQDSGGAGKQRGGLGIIRQIRALRDSTTFNAISDCYIHGAEGINGGGPGGFGGHILNPGRDSERKLPSKIAHLELNAGESIRIQTPGGGGFGHPGLRRHESILSDLRNGYISYSSARSLYGMK